MSTAQKIARLEALLARVTERKNAPRPARGSLTVATRAPVAAPPQRPAPPAPPAKPAAKPAAQPPAAPPSSAAMSPTPPRVPAPPSTARAQEDLPDLDFAEEVGPQSESQPALTPSWRPPASESEATEFEIPAHRPAPSIRPANEATPSPIELATSEGEAMPEVDHAPLATAVPQPAARGERMAEPSVERFEVPALASTEVIEVRPLPPPTVRGFRAILQRSLTLRPKK